MTNTAYYETQPTSSAHAPPRIEHLFFDVETVPDYTRENLFNLPRVEPRATRLPEDLPSVDVVLEDGVKQIQSFLDEFNPDEVYVTSMAHYETRNKSRAGIQDAIARYLKKRHADSNADSKRHLILSTTPEYCRLASIAVYSSQVSWSGVAIDLTSERNVIEAFWREASNSRWLVGWNVLAFDLPVLLFRSALLKVGPKLTTGASRLIDLRKYGSNDVIDLYQRLQACRSFTKGVGSLDAQYRLAGLPPIETALKDGSEVSAAWEEGRHEDLRLYNTSDCLKVERLHRFYEGLYW